MLKRVSKNLFCFAVLVCLSAWFHGCNISGDSPDPDTLVTMEVGDSQQFTVDYTGSAGNKVEYTWSCTEGPIDNYGSAPSGDTYTFKPAIAGHYTLRCTIVEYNYDFYPLIIPVRTEYREWNAEVAGLRFDPEDTNVFTATTTFTAGAWPEATYSYIWRLDGSQVSNAGTWTVDPSALGAGTHTLAVTATGGGVSYTRTREIYIPAKALRDSGGNRITGRLFMDSTSDGGLVFLSGTNLYKFSGYKLVTEVTVDVPLNCKSMRSCADGGYVMAGYVENAGTGLDYEIIKINGSGETQWSKIFGGSAYDYAYDVIETADGGFIVVGGSYSQDIPGYARSTSDLDIYTVKLDAQGELVWQRLYGGTNAEAALTVEKAVDGGYLIAGQFYDSSDNSAYAGKIDDAGALQWEQIYTDYTSANQIRPTSEGGYVLKAYNYDDSNYYVIKLDGLGALEWQSNCRTADPQYFYDIRQKASGGYILVKKIEKLVPGVYAKSVLSMVHLDAGGTVIDEKFIVPVDDIDPFISTLEQSNKLTAVADGFVFPFYSDLFKLGPEGY